MSLEQNSSKLTDVQPASPLEDLRQAPLALRLGFGLIGSGLAAYLFCFGILAVAGIWRSSFFNPVQILGVVVLLTLQAWLVWGVRLKPLVGNLGGGVLWSVPLALVILGKAGPDDLGHASLLATLPFMLSLVNGVALVFLTDALDVPPRRGDSGG